MNQQETQSIVQAVLAQEGIAYRTHADDICMNMRLSLGEIPTAVRVQPTHLMLYARLPVQGAEAELALHCNRINCTLGDGCLIVREAGDVLLKQTLYLTDALSVWEMLPQALRRQRYLAQSCTQQLQSTMLRGSK